MIKQIVKLIFISSVILSTTNAKLKAKQEITKAKNWIISWDTCGGDGAIKTNGTLWQFGKLGKCNIGQINPIDPETGKPLYSKKYTYYLKPKKIGSGFSGAKIINGNYRVYAIKRDGSLWGWGEKIGTRAKKLSSSKNWADFSVVYEGNGCCAFDIGLKRDGTLWRFPEFMRPLRLRKVGKEVWSKIIIDCCTIYGQKRDGSIWVKKESNPFKRYSKSRCNYTNKNLCLHIKSNFRKVPKYRILNNKNRYQRVKPAPRAGTLWNYPKLSFQ